MPRSQPPSFSDLFSLLLRSRQAREPPNPSRFIFHPERRLFSQVQHVVAQIFAPSTWDDDRGGGDAAAHGRHGDAAHPTTPSALRTPHFERKR
jgi:hypothetical protein